MDNELIIHEGHNILITQERVVIGKNSYQLNDINFIECLIERFIKGFIEHFIEGFMKKYVIEGFIGVL